MQITHACRSPAVAWEQKRRGKCARLLLEKVIPSSFSGCDRVILPPTSSCPDHFYRLLLVSVDGNKPEVVGCKEESHGCSQGSQLQLWRAIIKTSFSTLIYLAAA